MFSSYSKLVHLEMVERLMFSRGVLDGGDAGTGEGEEGEAAGLPRPSGRVRGPSAGPDLSYKVISFAILDCVRTMPCWFNKAGPQSTSRVAFAAHNIAHSLSPQNCAHLSIRRHLPLSKCQHSDNGEWKFRAAFMKVQ